MDLFSILSWLAWALVVGGVWLTRGRPFAFFMAFVLGIHTLSSTTLVPHLPGPWWAWLYPQVAAYGYFLALLLRIPRGTLYRALLGWPASWFVGATFLGFPWAILYGVGLEVPLPWLPYALGLLGLLQSLRATPRVTALSLDRADVQHGPKPYSPQGSKQTRPLRLVQITDPHLGTFMSERRLARICQDAVEAKPDLILLTGDFLTVESQHEAGALTRALAPLRAMPGRVFACRGNHDLEAPQIVAQALAANGVRLLIDEAELVPTEAGLVQVVGADFSFFGREEKLAALCTQYPRVAGALRLVLLHDPGSFRYLPKGEGDLVLAGHTHGGQVGLLSLGLSWTFVRGLTSIPDHGFWARGTDRLYVHRGNGHYGFPLRIGVPAEEGILEVHQSSAAPA
jgi:hypothetical protein